LHLLTSPSQNALPVKQQSRQETTDDYLVDVAGLFVDKRPSQDSAGNRSQSSKTLPVSGESLTGRRRTRFISIGAHMDDRPTRFPSNLHGDSAYSPAEIHYTNVGSIGLSHVANHSRGIPDGSSSTSRGHVQSASFNSSSPSQETSHCDHLPTDEVDPGCQSKSTDVVMQTACQPGRTAAHHVIGSADNSRNTISPPVSRSSCNVPSPIHENGPSQENTLSKSPTTFLTTIPYTEIGSSSLTQSLNSSENISATGILPAIHSTGPYPRRPSNHPSFLQYDRD